MCPRADLGNWCKTDPSWCPVCCRTNSGCLSCIAGSSDTRCSRNRSRFVRAAGVQWYNQPTKQTTKQTTNTNKQHKQTTQHKQTNKQASKQTNKQTNKPTNQQMVECAHVNIYAPSTFPRLIVSSVPVRPSEVPAKDFSGSPCGAPSRSCSMPRWLRVAARRLR